MTLVWLDRFPGCRFSHALKDAPVAKPFVEAVLKGIVNGHGKHAIGNPQAHMFELDAPFVTKAGQRSNHNWLYCVSRANHLPRKILAAASTA